MEMNIVLATPDAQFGELIKNYLEKSGLIKISITGSDTEIHRKIKSLDPSALILDSRLRDINIFDVSIQLKESNPSLKTIALISEKDRKPEWVMVQAFDESIIAPFAPSDLVDKLLKVLRKKVPAFVTSSMTGQQTSLLDEEQSRDINLDISKAAQYLTQLSLKSSAQAALLTRNGKIVAYAGELDRVAAEELGYLIGVYWEKDGGNDFARYISLETTETDHMIYATSLENGLILALVYEADMPFSEIRTQAGELSRKLARIKEKRTAVQLSAQQYDQEEHGNTIRSNGWLEEFEDDDQVLVEPSEHKHEGSTKVLRTGPFAEIHDVSESRVSKRKQTETRNMKEHSDLPPKPEVMETRKLSNKHVKPRIQHQTTEIPAIREKVLQKERDASRKRVLPAKEHSDQPVISSETVSSTMSAPVLFNIGYSIVLVPRLPTHYLVSDLAKSLSEWISRYCLAFGWRLVHLAIHPNYIELSVKVEPDHPSREVLQTISELTSERIFENFPKLKRDNPSGKFWAPGFIVVVGTKPVPPAIIKKFIQQTRKYQGV